MCHLFLHYNLLSIGSVEINKITLSIWDDNYCGSNYGPKIEIFDRQTSYHGPFHRGTTLIWDNNGENRYGGKNLGGVSGFQVYPRSCVSYLSPTCIWFRIVGGGGDDFCPKTLTIYCKDGTKYVTGYDMTDWVDSKKGGGWRKASKNGVIKWPR